MTPKPNYVKLYDLDVGDTFWFVSRGWIVEGEVVEGTRACLCLDDDGTPDLDVGLMVEKL